MKRSLLTTVLVLMSLLMLAQTPQAFNYSAVVRNGTGTPVANQNVNFRLSILRGSPTGANVYTETQATTTDVSGIVNLEIGRGSVASGNFSAIDWGSNSYYMQIEVDISGGTTFQMMGTTQFLSVPYALYSKYSSNTVPVISSLDTSAAGPVYNNHFQLLQTLKVVTPQNMVADTSGNIISGGYPYITSYSQAGTTNFSYTIDDDIKQVRLDNAGNIYMLALAYPSGSTITVAGTTVPVTDHCSTGFSYIAKFNKAGNLQWIKFPNLNYCTHNSAIFLMDVDAVGNVYVSHANQLKKLNSNGDSIFNFILPDSVYAYLRVNNNGGLALSSHSGFLSVFSANGLLKFNRQIYGFEPIYDIYYGDDSIVYMAGCVDKCFSIDEKQYCERADGRSTFKLIGLDSTGNLKSYLRYNNSPSVDNCIISATVSSAYPSSLFRYKGKLSTILNIPTFFYNNGIKYNRGYYLVTF